MITVIKGGNMTHEEQKIYEDYIKEKFPRFNITELTITLETDEKTGEEMVKLEYHYENKPEFNVPFERIRRITGYLTKMNRTNDAKTAEIHDRLKHNT
jgi:anaerobic ribonucleoside-triphosphate reductase